MPMLAAVTLVPALCTAAFLATERGQDAWLDQAVFRLESWGAEVTDERYARLEAILPDLPYLGAAASVALIPAATALVSAMVFGAFRRSTRTAPSFTQVFAVVTHANAVLLTQQVLLTPLNYARQSWSSPNLSALFPMLDEASFAARLLGTFDLFLVWWTVVLAIGVSVLYARPIRSVLPWMLGAYGAVAVVLVTGTTILGER